MFLYWILMLLCSLALIYHKYLINYKNEPNDHEVYTLWIYFCLNFLNFLLTIIPEKSTLPVDSKVFFTFSHLN